MSVRSPTMLVSSVWWRLPNHPHSFSCLAVLTVALHVALVLKLCRHSPQIAVDLGCLVPCKYRVVCLSIGVWNNQSPSLPQGQCLLRTLIPQMSCCRWACLSERKNSLALFDHTGKCCLLRVEQVSPPPTATRSGTRCFHLNAADESLNWRLLLYRLFHGHVSYVFVCCLSMQMWHCSTGTGSAVFLRRGLFPSEVSTSVYLWTLFHRLYRGTAEESWSVAVSRAIVYDVNMKKIADIAGIGSDAQTYRNAFCVLRKNLVFLILFRK